MSKVFNNFQFLKLRRNICSYVISPSSRRYKIKKIIWAENFSHNFIVAQKKNNKASRSCLFCRNSLEEPGKEWVKVPQGDKKVTASSQHLLVGSQQKKH